MPHGAHDPVLTVAVALAAGVLAQAAARHLRLPGIVLLLGSGVVLGPDVLGWVRPESLGSALPAVTGFAVAIVLFDGGLNLDPRRLRGRERVVTLLVTVGVVVTGLGGAVAAHLLMEWPWRTAALFGSLVTVTGPTVVTPLLRRLRVGPRLEAILETEGVLIDAVGAVVAVVTLEVVLAPTARAAALGAAAAPVRLLAGLVGGIVGGGLLSLLLRSRRLVPAEYHNILSLAWAVLVYKALDAMVPESGIMAAIAAGAVVGNTHPRDERELKEFKEQLTTLVIGLLFILLAADVRVAEVTALGPHGLAVVAVLMLVVRPLDVLLCTAGSDLTWRDRVFLGWLAPRGIVAAAVASLFHMQMAASGDPAAAGLRALVFLVIAVTVVVQGVTAAPLAAALGLRQPTDRGYVILGGNALARLLARLLGDLGHEAVLIDNNARLVNECEAAGLRAYMGNGLEEGILRRARAHTRRGAIGLVSNEAINMEFARRCRREMRVPLVLAALQRANQSLDETMAEREDVRVLFGCEIDLAAWIGDVTRDRAEVAPWRPVSVPGKTPPPLANEAMSRHALPLVWQRGTAAGPVDETIAPAPDLTVWWAVTGEEGRRSLTEAGWEPVPEEAETRE